MKRIMSGIALWAAITLAVAAPAFAGHVMLFDVVQPIASLENYPLGHTRFGVASGLEEKTLGPEALVQIPSGPFGPTTSSSHMARSIQDLFNRGLDGLAIRDAARAFGLEG